MNLQYLVFSEYCFWIFLVISHVRNKFTFIAQPLEPGLADDIDNGVVNINWSKKDIRMFFQNNYEWDILSARYA